MNTKIWTIECENRIVLINLWSLFKCLSCSTLLNHYILQSISAVKKKTIKVNRRRNPCPVTQANTYKHPIFVCRNQIRIFLQKKSIIRSLVWYTSDLFPLYEKSNNDPPLCTNSFFLVLTSKSENSWLSHLFHYPCRKTWTFTKECEPKALLNYWFFTLLFMFFLKSLPKFFSSRGLDLKSCLPQEDFSLWNFVCETYFHTYLSRYSFLR